MTDRTEEDLVAHLDLDLGDLELSDEEATVEQTAVNSGIANLTPDQRVKLMAMFEKAHRKFMRACQGIKAITKEINRLSYLYDLYDVASTEPEERAQMDYLKNSSFQELETHRRIRLVYQTYARIKVDECQRIDDVLGGTGFAFNIAES